MPRQGFRRPRPLKGSFGNHHQRLLGEALEPRWALTWAGVPPVSIAPPSAATIALNAQNDATIAASIATTEVDYYSFTAGASGTYRIATATPTSNLDTVLGIFSASGQRLTYNDDTSRTNLDSQLTINLTAGTRYYVGVTNYSSSTRGAYNFTVDGPAASTPVIPVTPTIDLAGAGLAVTSATTWGQTITAQATVRNTGNTASGAFTEQWYLSRDQFGSSDDILLSRTGGAGTSLSVATIAAGGTTSVSATLQLPSALPSGWAGTGFYLVMRTDAASQVTETNESNNFGQVGVGSDSSAITIGSTVSAPQTGGFQIQLNMTGLTASQQAIFQQAADRWEQVIVGDLPNATYRGQTVDDLLIDASASSIDGVNGVLGQAGPDAFRSGSRLPYHGGMEFDSADIANMERSGLLLSVVEHEMGHILGIGTIWSSLGLLSGAGGSNPIFTGSQATAAYNQIFGTSASGVPVESGGGSGTADSHWRDSLLGAELMTGYAGPGVNLPLSLITVASLADLGYTVNRSAADAYTAPRSSSSSLASTVTSRSASARSSEVAMPTSAVDAIMAGLACADHSSASARSTTNHRS